MGSCSSGTEESAIYPQGPAEEEMKPVIGIAWRSDNNDAFYQYWETTIKEAGGYPVHLQQVKSNDNWYSSYDMLAPTYVDSDGMLSQKCATTIKKNGYAYSNAADVMNGIDAVFFPGGEDISTTLFSIPEQMLVNEGFNPTRDISDYLLMDYCLSKDVPIFCICRGAQMLAIASGASLIQDMYADGNL